MQQTDLFPMICAATTEPISEVGGRMLVEPLGAVIWTGGRAALEAATASAARASELGNVHTGRTFGGMLTEFIWQRMSNHFADLPGSTPIETRRLIRLENRGYLRFRSLRSDGLPWPPQSETGYRIARQNPEDVYNLTDLPILTIGYRLSSTRADFSYISLLCLRHEKEWWWNAEIADSDIVQAANVQGGSDHATSGRNRYSKKVSKTEGAAQDDVDQRSTRYASETNDATEDNVTRHDVPSDHQDN